MQVQLSSSSSSTYLQVFIDMVNASMASMMPAQTAYAEFMSSLVGPPLALVSMGWSIELAAEAYKPHATLSKTELRTALLRDKNVVVYPMTTIQQQQQQEEEEEEEEGTESDSPDAADNMNSSTLSSSSSSSSLYCFKIKLGDGLRAYDGLAGYWPSLAPTHLKNPSGGPIPGNALDFSILYSYYGPSEAPITHISTSNFPVLHPYHVDPTSRASGTNPETFHAQHCRALQAFGALIDPFTAVHGYSEGILPVAELKLLGWTWQQAFRKTDAFFHLGPLIVSRDHQGKRSSRGRGWEE